MKKLQITAFILVIILLASIAYWCAESSQLLVDFYPGVSQTQAVRYINQCSFGNVIIKPATGTPAPVLELTLDRIQRIIAERCLEWGPAPAQHLLAIDKKSSFFLSITNINY